MLGYLESRNEKIEKLHNIYLDGRNIPDYIEKLLDIPEVKRLNGIEQNAGIGLTGFNLFNYKYSVLDHSFGVALILNNFVTNKEQVIAALLHDLAVPAFSYSSTYIDEKNFESDENKLTIYDAIVGSDELFEMFLKSNISIDEMCDYTKYPLAYNIVPTLCAHTLERVMHTLYLDGICTEDEIKDIYSSLVVMPNEENIPEICFNDTKTAEKFCLFSLEVGEQQRSYEAKASMKFIADTLGAMLRRRVISQKDLYTYSDKAIMNMGLDCSDKRISDRWKCMKDLNRVHKKFNIDMTKQCHKLEMGLSYVDPLIRIKNGRCMRVSENSKECKEAIDRFLNSDTDLYFYVDYID